MGAETAAEPQEQEQGRSHTPGAIPEGAPPAIHKAAGGEAKDVSPVEEGEALRWLLASGGKPIPYTIDVEWATEDGPRTIPWRVQSIPAATIERIEKDNRDEKDPMAGFNEPRCSAEIVAAATLSPDIRSEQFRTPAEATDRNPDRLPDADPVDALLRVFRFQSGLLIGMAGEVRSVSGFDPRKVGSARRSVARAVGNSSS